MALTLRKISEIFSPRKNKFGDEILIQRAKVLLTNSMDQCYILAMSGTLLENFSGITSQRVATAYFNKQNHTSNQNQELRLLSLCQATA